MLWPSRSPDVARRAPLKIARLFFAPASLQVDVPLRVLEIRPEPAFPARREQIFVFLGRFVGLHELGIVGHRVEQRMHVDPVTIRVFEAFVVERGFGWHEALRQPRFFHQLDLKTRRGHDVDGESAGFGLGDRALQHSFACPAIERRLDVRDIFS